MLLSSLLLHFLFLLLLFGGVFAFHFEIDGHFSDITVTDVQHESTKRAISEEKLRKRIESLFGGDLDDFFVHSFSIHGEDLHSSAIFTAFCTTSIPRSRIIQLVAEQNDIDLFRIRKLYNLPPPPKDSSKDAAVNLCLNGGFLLPNNSCSCPHFFIGDSCEMIECLNGGIANNDQCSCPPGSYSLNCEQRGCLPGVQGNVDVLKTSFILVVNQKSTMAYVLDQLANKLGQLLNNDFGDARYDNYIVVNYIHTRNALQITKNHFKTEYEMVDYLNTLVYSIQGTDKQPTQRAALAAQSFYPLMKAFSNVYIFCDSYDEDARPANYMLSSHSIENELVLQTIAWRNRLVYFFSEASDLNPSEDGYETFQRAAMATLGDVYTYRLAEVDSVIPVLTFYEGSDSLVALYDISPQLQMDINIPTGPGDGYVTVLVTVKTGSLPKVTDQNRLNMQILANGTRFAMYQMASNDKAIILHAGNRINIRAWVYTTNTMILRSAYDSNVDGGTVYLTSSYLNSISGLAVGNQPALTTLQWISLKQQQTISSKFDGVQRSTECTFTTAFRNIQTKCPPGPLGQRVTLSYDADQTLTRLLPGICLTEDSVAVNPFQCFNGGSKIGARLCKCTSDWEGTQCNIPNCFNGGKVNPFPGNGFGPCNCAPGFSGDHCNILNCTTPADYPIPSQSTTLALVLQSSLSQAQIAPPIDQGLTQLLKQLKGQYDDFILTTFLIQSYNGRDNNVINTTTYMDSNSFQTAVDTIRYLPTPSNTQDSLGALTSTLVNRVFYSSTLFLFVDAPPTDTTNEADVLRIAVEQNVEINIVVTAPFGLIEKCMTSQQQLFYEQLAAKSGGIFLNLCQKLSRAYDQNPIKSLFVAYADSHHSTEIISEQVVYSNLSPTLFFFVDQPNNDVFLIVNCPTIETFSANILNYDVGSSYVGTLIVMPFLGVYKVPTSAVNTQGYLASVTLDQKVEASCNMKVRIKSKHAIFIRFSPDPSFDAQLGYAGYGVETYPVVHINNPNLNRSVLPELESRDDRSGSFFGYGTFSTIRTNSCSYEYFYKVPYICPRPADSLTLQLKGITYDGLHYFRTLRTFCYLQPGKCANGGYRLSNGLCKCPPSYTGTYCQSPKCLNGFPTDSSTFNCMCGAKYTGQFCQYPVCDNWNFMESVDPRNNGPKQITFVLNRNVDQLLVNVQLNNIIQSVVTATESADQTILYTLITYDQFNVYRIISTSHSDVFIQYFQNEIQNYQKTTAVMTMSIDALVDAWKLGIEQPGLIFLFMGTPPQTPKSTSFDNFLEQKINTQVNVFYTPQNGGPYPKLPQDTLSGQLYTAVKQSGGRFLPLVQNSVSQLAPLLIGASQMKELTFEYALDNCAQGGCHFTFHIESQFRIVEITLTGIDVSKQGNYKVTDSTTKYLTINSENIIFKDNEVIVFRFNSSQTKAGIWTVDLDTTTGGALIQVRIDSDFRVYPGFTINPFDDFVHQVPFTGLGLNRSTYMTFRLVDGMNNLDNKATLNTLDIYRYNFIQPQLGGSQIDNLFITKRDVTSCAYQYVTTEWNVDIISNQQKFTLTGVDGDGLIFQRTFFYQFPQYNQRAATCINGLHDSWGQCICTNKSKWTGDYCQTPVCNNGGTESYGICICRNGYYGDFCENDVESI